jgi:5-methyltetrahydrofolate--homocysteine methyltransferase
MIAEEYKGIRHRLSACPDHLEKPIWKLLNVEQEIGVTLTENGNVASIIGFWILFRKSGSILDWENKKEDQVVDYAKRRSIPKVATKW